MIYIGRLIFNTAPLIFISHVWYKSDREDRSRRDSIITEATYFAGLPRG
jgi:hypothetical protein